MSVSQNYILHMKFSEFTFVIIILVKFDILFLGLPWEIFFGVTTDDLLPLKPKKNVKKIAIFFNFFWYKVFVHWKLKLLNFLVDSVLKHFASCKAIEDSLGFWIPGIVFQSGTWSPDSGFHSLALHGAKHSESIGWGHNAAVRRSWIR